MNIVRPLASSAGADRKVGILMMCAMLIHGMATGGASTWLYVSPVPGSTRVSRETNIIFRPDNAIDPSTMADDAVVAWGTSSGQHAGRLTLSDDGRTLVFLPSIPFSSGECVTVRINSGIRTASGTALAPVTYSFTVTTTPRELQSRPVIVPDMPGLAAGPSVQGPSLPVDTLFPDFPEITVSVSDDPAPGYIFLSNLVFDLQVPNVPYLMVLDNRGHTAFRQRLSGNGLDFKLQPNGLMTYFSAPISKFVEGDTSFPEVTGIACRNGYVTDPHDLRLLPNGHALLLGQDNEIVNMDTIVPGGRPLATVVGAVIQELDRSGNVVFQWRSWDHFLITDATHEDLTAATIDYVHANALEVDNDGNILLSSRHMDEITKIDRQTGDILWRMGGRNNMFTFVNDTLGFSHQHSIRRIANGDITLFDNGNFHTPPFSRAVEYRLDEVHRTASLVWQYRNTPDVYGSAMGYVQRLDNGNTLIGWGASNPSVTEVRPDGTKVLEMSLPPGVYSYRAYRFPYIQNGSLQPQAYTLQNYPNPFNPSTTIRYALPRDTHVTLTIYDMLGRRISQPVDEQQQAGYHEIVFDGSGLASGVYFSRLQVSGYSAVSKMVLMK